LSTSHEAHRAEPAAAPSERPPLAAELETIFTPWDLPGMGVMFSRIFASGVAAVVVALLLEWRLDDPGPWPIVVIVAFTVLGLAWAFHGAAPEIRRMREESERELEEFLRSRGRR
jgi:Flp pilus assembly protein TadB